MLVRKMMAVAAVAVLLAAGLLAVTGCENAADGDGGNKWTAADIGINMVSVTGGTVPLTNDYQPTVSSFYMSETEVTQKQWKEVVGNNGYGNHPSADHGVGDNFPMYNVNWYDTIVFCNKLSMKEGLTPCYKKGSETDPAKWGNPPSRNDAEWKAITCDWTADGYRLPTEAEWEYAARGGRTNPYKTYSGTEGNDENALKEVAWYDENSGDGGGRNNRKSHEVKTKPNNRNPIKDMSGNVCEWCWDWYGSYDTSKTADPTGPSSSGTKRVVRGGSWYDIDDNCAVSFRSDDNTPHNRLNFTLGFRVVRRN